ncbi:DoxX family protein [Micromonospora sp. NPDC094482]|uniref:DoxX family protein n=1 Tax=unclassified Micromonospora TaxID=2617518 RepID=UPI00331B4E69
MSIPEPIWPVVALAILQLADAVLCVKPVEFVRQCLKDVAFPERFWPVLAPLKAGAAGGLLLGIFIPYLGLATASALVTYFAVAVALHVRQRDFGRNFTNATGMLAICVAVTWWSFLR